MTSYPPTPDEAAHRELAAKAVHAAAGLIAFILNHIDAAPPGPLAAGMIQTFLRTMIKPGEALVRRAIWLLAALLPAPKPRAATTARLPVKIGAVQQTPRAPRIPAFRLTEPAPRPCTLPPRASAPNALRAAKPLDDDALNLLNYKFVNRLMALRAACADPDRCALRLRLRRCLLGNPPPSRPLSDKAPPGLIRHRVSTYLNLFNQLDPAATLAWRRLIDTS
jgi:hypothetical protein